MPSRKPYRTRQREVVLDALRGFEGSYVTIADLAASLRDAGAQVGLSTLYRNLDRLESEGVIAKANVDGVSGACYRYLGEACEGPLFCLKCEACGAMTDLDCPELAKLYRHIAEGHRFSVNPGKTVFYGMCASCAPVRCALGDERPDDSTEATSEE